MAGTICTIAGALCLLYYLIIILYAGITADFSWFWLLSGMLFVIIGGLSGKIGRLPVGLRLMAGGILAVFLLTFLLLCGKVLMGMRNTGSAGLDYVVVLGAQVRGELPSKALQKRLEKALQYARENEETIFILSGGQGPGEKITEAECMRRWLMQHGISEQRMILEENSINTRENLDFSHCLSGCAGKRTGILSNDFHVYRAVSLARKLGYEAPEGIAAESDGIMQLHYVVREVFALVKEKIKGYI